MELREFVVDDWSCELLMHNEARARAGGWDDKAARQARGIFALFDRFLNEEYGIDDLAAVRQQHLAGFEEFLGNLNCTFGKSPKDHNRTGIGLEPGAGHCVDEIVAITLQARDHLKRFNIEARAALLSYSNFGSRDGETSEKMRLVYRRLKEVAPDLMVDGEMQGDLAISEDLRERYIPDSVLKGEANLLIFPNLESANLSMTLLKELKQRAAGGADPDGHAAAGPHTRPLGDQPRRRQHGGHRRLGGGKGALATFAIGNSFRCSTHICPRALQVAQLSIWMPGQRLNV